MSLWDAADLPHASCHCCILTARCRKPRLGSEKGAKAMATYPMSAK